LEAMTPPHRYRHFGLDVASNVALPLPLPLPPSPSPSPSADDADPDVAVDVTWSAQRPEVDSTWTAIAPAGAWRAPSSGGSRLRLRMEGRDDSWVEFVIDGGGKVVTMTLGETANFTDATELLATSVFACVLAQRGATCLHAAVVGVDDAAIALVGEGGAGKS